MDTAESSELNSDLDLLLSLFMNYKSAARGALSTFVLGCINEKNPRNMLNRS
jgi:hypothetical protein